MLKKTNSKKSLVHFVRLVALLKTYFNLDRGTQQHHTTAYTKRANTSPRTTQTTSYNTQSTLRSPVTERHASFVPHATRRNCEFSPLTLRLTLKPRRREKATRERWKRSRKEEGRCSFTVWGERSYALAFGLCVLLYKGRKTFAYIRTPSPCLLLRFLHLALYYVSVCNRQ